MKRKITFFVLLAVLITSLSSITAWAICDVCIENNDAYDWSLHCDNGCFCVYEPCHAGCGGDYLSFYCGNQHDICDGCYECLKCSECSCDGGSSGGDSGDDTGGSTGHNCGDYVCGSCGGCTVCECECDTESCEHSSTTTTVTKEATCTAIGTKVTVCDYCGDTMSESSYGPLGHDHSVFFVTYEPICDAAGYTMYKCSREGCLSLWTDPNSYTTIGHVAKNVSHIPPSCTQEGEILRECKFCGRSMDSISIPKLNHDFSVFYEKIEPVCTASGYTMYKCSRVGCNELYTDPASFTEADHFPEEVSRINASCSKEGTIYYKCKYCGRELSSEVIPVLEHTEVVTITPSTCTSPGYHERVCSQCGTDMGSEEIPMVEHDLYDVEEVSATCNTQGNTAGKACTYCDYTTVSVIGALGHKYVDSIVPPTCSKSGYTTHKCTVCDDEYTDSYVSGVGHTYVMTITPATCVEPGITTFTCFCGDSYTANPVDIVPHNYVNNYCTICGRSESGVTPPSETEPVKPGESEPVQTEPVAPDETEPSETDPVTPDETEPSETTPSVPKPGGGAVVSGDKIDKDDISDVELHVLLRRGGFILGFGLLLIWVAAATPSRENKSKKKGSRKR